MVQAIDKEAWARVFGAPDPERRAGAQRLCKVCGGWHMLDAWPHNCVEPDWRPEQRLASPMVIGDVPEHSPAQGVHITTRQEQRDYMARNGLVEHEAFTSTAGTGRQDFTSKTYEADLVQDIKRALQEDPLNRPPVESVEQANADAADEEKVDTSNVEIVSNEHTASA